MSQLMSRRGLLKEKTEASWSLRILSSIIKQLEGENFGGALKQRNYRVESQLGWS